MLYNANHQAPAYSAASLDAYHAILDELKAMHITLSNGLNVVGSPEEAREDVQNEAEQ